VGVALPPLPVALPEPPATATGEPGLGEASWIEGSIASAAVSDSTCTTSTHVAPSTRRASRWPPDTAIRSSPCTFAPARVSFTDSRMAASPARAARALSVRATMPFQKASASAHPAGALKSK
jgi:hypothetical protein